VLSPNWKSSRDGRSLSQLVADGHVIVICPNSSLPFPDDTFDVVFTNSVPIDMTSFLGPGVQSAEIRRILKTGGQWIRDGVLEWIKT
jgi:SAM-dependent methyltransferase